jgi:hypothetical protein
MVNAMKNTILELFDQYRQRVDSDTAAATLVLAHVNLEKQSVAVADVDEWETLNPGDVAKKLSVSPATVLGWIKSGQLKAANIAKGRRPRFIIQRANLVAFLEFRRLIPAAPQRRRSFTTQSKRY